MATSTLGSLIQAKEESVSVAQDGTTELLEVVVAGAARFGFEVRNHAGQALDAFEIHVKFHPDGEYVSMFSAAADFTQPEGLMVACSGDLTTLASGATGWFVLDVLGVYAVKLLASSGNVAGSTVSVFARGG